MFKSIQSGNKWYMKGDFSCEPVYKIGWANREKEYINSSDSGVLKKIDIEGWVNKSLRIRLIFPSFKDALNFYDENKNKNLVPLNICGKQPCINTNKEFSLYFKENDRQKKFFISKFLDKVSKKLAIPSEIVKDIKNMLKLFKSEKEFKKDILKQYKSSNLENTIKFIEKNRPNLEHNDLYFWLGQELLKKPNTLKDAVKILLKVSGCEEFLFKLGNGLYTNNKLFSNARERTEWALRCFCKIKNIPGAGLMRDRLFHELCYGVQKGLSKVENFEINTTDADLLIRLAKIIFTKNSEIEKLRKKIILLEESKISKQKTIGLISKISPSKQSNNFPQKLESVEQKEKNDFLENIIDYHHNFVGVFFNSFPSSKNGNKLKKNTKNLILKIPPSKK